MKLNCPKHDDQHASCHVYDTHAWCFAGCGKVALDELGMAARTAPPRPKENVRATLDYIQSLNKAKIRGFDLPFDEKGYYLVWPKQDFYKLRKFEGEPRYVGPSGHKPPPFWAQRGGSSRLFLVEGEYNALSVAQVYPASDVLSLGAAGELNPKSLATHLSTLTQYDTIVVIVDRDAAGALAAIHAKSVLAHKVPEVSILFTDLNNDCNDILVNHGKEALREEIDRRMLTRL